MKTRVLFAQKKAGESYVVKTRDKHGEVTFVHTGVQKIEQNKDYIILVSGVGVEFVPVGTAFYVSDGPTTDCEAYTDELEMSDLAGLMAHMQQGE
tara:strand:+ start:138 stop:422 length:285 start_codon:yes stop_codon:yes gene_type:complete